MNIITEEDILKEYFKTTEGDYGIFINGQRARKISNNKASWKTVGQAKNAFHATVENSVIRATTSFKNSKEFLEHLINKGIIEFKKIN